MIRGDAVDCEGKRGRATRLERSIRSGNRQFQSRNDSQDAYLLSLDFFFSLRMRANRALLGRGIKACINDDQIILFWIRRAPSGVC